MMILPTPRSHKSRRSLQNRIKMKIIAAASMLSLASAFAPSQNVARTETQLNLWGEPTQKDGESDDKSKALPFAPRPKLLDGTLAGDVGFE